MVPINDLLVKKHQKIKDGIDGDYLQTLSDTNLDDMLKKMYALVLQNQHTDQKFYNTANDFIDYLIKLDNVFQAVTYARLALVTYNLPIDHKQIQKFNEFHSKYGAEILGIQSATGIQPAKTSNLFQVAFGYLIVICLWPLFLVAWLLGAFDS
jgi:adenosine deaminase